MNPPVPNSIAEPAQGWVFYDGDCGLCTRAATRFAGLLARHQFRLAPLQAEWVRAQLGLGTEEPLAEMKLWVADARVYGGAAALVQIARRIWWAWPLFAMAHLPGGMAVLNQIYRRVAANRNCLGNVCQVGDKQKLEKLKTEILDYLPLIALPAVALGLRHWVPAWVFMWLLALAVYFGCKLLTWRRAVRQLGTVSWRRSLGYLFGWVGMDARHFLRDGPVPAAPRARDWLPASGRILLGLGLIWGVVRCIPADRPLVAGWTGMVGLILCLHFGWFDWLALAWQRAGVDAQPLMRTPMRSTSLAEFWGRRWNGAFHLLVNDFVFRPGARLMGVTAATLLVFLLSGLIHDLILSVPAWGGYGLPTAYFVLQGFGVILERSAPARWLGLGRGWRGHFFTILWVVGPVGWLFTPIFVHHIILPMLKALGAT